jgi:ABC-2 type transport system ATP-binding protein
MTALLEVHELCKSFGEVHAVRRISFTAGKGEILGLIGPDGAGKTTLLRMLVTLLRPDSGTFRMLDLDPAIDASAIRALVGYMPQRFSLYPDLSVDQNLGFFADLFSVPRHEIAERKRRLYEFSRLEPFASRLAGRLSGGMKQKLALSCTLIHDPVMLLLDEPTTGVDPVSRTEFWKLLSELRDRGVSILVSTPYMDEALLCDRTIVMHEGRILADDTPPALIQRYPYIVYNLPVASGLTVDLLESIDCIHSVQGYGDSWHLAVGRDVEQSSLTADLTALTGKEVQVERITASFEDVFISLIEETVKR